MRALVLGGYRAVGAEVASQLRADGDDCPVAGRDPARAELVVDLHEPGATTYRTALARVDVVVNAAGVEDPALVTGRPPGVVEQFTHILAKEFGPRRITVNAVSPGATETETAGRARASSSWPAWRR